MGLLSKGQKWEIILILISGCAGFLLYLFFSSGIEECGSIKNMECILSGNFEKALVLALVALFFIAGLGAVIIGLFL